MSKIDVGVGEDFPINDGQPAEGEAAGPEGERCGRREERSEEERARHAEWRSRKRGFRDDVRRSFRQHFGDHPFDRHHGGWLRVLLVVALLVLAIAILPHLFLLVALVLAVIFFAAHRGGFYHYHRTMPRHDADS
jgi:Flp pilus assembly protein TadB